MGLGGVVGVCDQAPRAASRMLGWASRVQLRSSVSSANSFNGAYIQLGARMECWTTETARCRAVQADVANKAGIPSTLRSTNWRTRN